MAFPSLVLASFRRHRVRTLFTILSIATAFAIFAVLQAIHTGMSGGLNYAQAQRILTLNRQLIGGTLPVRYGEQIAHIPGVRSVAWSKQLSGYFRTPSEPVAVQMFSPTVLKVYPEFVFDAPDQPRTWLSDRHGLVAGAAAAARHGWKVGDDVPIAHGPLLHDGSRVWHFRLDGIFGRNLPIGLQDLVIGHYAYFDRGIADPGLKDRVYQFDSRVADAHDLARIGHAIDAHFASASPQTLSFSEQKAVMSGMRAFGDIGAILLFVGTAVFFTMLLVAGNTMSNSVHERIQEFAVLRAVGFTRLQMVRLVMAEATAMVLPGAALGLGLGWLLCRLMTPYVAWALVAFSLSPWAVVAGIGLAALIAAVIGIGPGWRVGMLSVAAALRRG